MTVSSARRVPVYALLLFTYLVLFVPSRIEIRDEEIFLTMSTQILETGVPRYPVGGEWVIPRFSPVYPAVLAVYASVARPIGISLYGYMSEASADILNWGIVSAFNLIFVTGIFVLLLLHVKNDAALWFLAITSSMLLFYGTTLFMEPFQAFLLLAAALALIRSRYNWSGLLLAFLIGVKLTNLVYVPVFFIFMLARIRRMNPVLLFLLLAAVLPVILHMLYNAAWRGSPLNFGYSYDYPDELTGRMVPHAFHNPFGRGLAGYLVSPGKSFLLYNPALALGLAGLVSGARRKEWLPSLCLALTVVTTLLYAAWSGWEGGVCYGPRFLVSMIPLVMVGFAYIDLARLRIPFAILVLAGWTINMMARAGALYPAYEATGRYGTGDSFPLTYDFFGVLLRAYGILWTGGTETVLLLPRLMGSSTTALGAWTCAVAGILLSVGRRAWIRHGRGDVHGRMLAPHPGL